MPLQLTMIFLYIVDVSPREIEEAQIFFVKLARKFQNEGKIAGFNWNFPPQHLYTTQKKISDGPVEILFENGTIAAQGRNVRGKREGKWQHFYETGVLLAEGNYCKGLRAGDWKFFYSNGLPRAIGGYSSDNRDGLWIEWDRKGSVTELEFEDGVRKKD